ncbi:cytochrome P450 phenylacetate hydroxylase [Penicillium canescens]|nr:cytochrome P450 phenylacetate hydroxylase [Penicillium canescens]
MANTAIVSQAAMDAWACLESFSCSLIAHPLNICLLLFLPLLLYEIHRLSARISGFSGPGGVPIIGNIAQIRWNAPEQYRRWAQKYGPVYQIQLGHVPVIVINSATAAKTLLSQNTQNMGSRPIFPTFHKADISYWPHKVISSTAGTTIGTCPYDESLKRRRKAATSGLNRVAIQTYLRQLDSETQTFISDIFESGNGGNEDVDPIYIIQRLSLSLSLTMNWGIPKLNLSSDLFREIAVVQNQISRHRSTTGNLQDYVPLLRLDPFGMRRRQAEALRKRRDHYLESLNRGLDDKMKQGTYQSCIRASIIKDEEAQLEADELASVSLTMLSAGLNTITAVLRWSIALLAEKPEIQEKALQAIRSQHSSEEPLCDPEDDQTCSYMRALVRELLRYYPPNRLSLPRESIAETLYETKVIPKGTTVFLNVWACNMDPTVFGDPEVFRPERWLENPRLPLFTYGIGYRMCVGFLLANRELYLVFMRLINSYEILKASPLDTDPVTGATDTTNLATMPKRYSVRFVPRNAAALKSALTGGAALL